MRRFTVGPAHALALYRRELEAHELELVQIAGGPHYLCRQAPDEMRVVAADRLAVAATRPPAVSSVTLALSAAGLIFSVTGVAVAAGWLSRARRHRR